MRGNPTPPPRGKRNPGTSEDVRLLAEADGETQAEAGRLPEVVVEDADPELNRAEAAEPTEARTEAADEGVLAEDPVEVEHVRQGLHRSPNVQSGCFVTVNKSKNCP